MPQKFCQHLDEYGALFVQAAASYHQCVSLVDRIMDPDSGGSEDNLSELLLDAVKQWEEETNSLRTTFEQLVADGQIKLPRQKGQQPRCATCKRKVRRLRFPEWEIVDDGPVRFRGEELAAPAAVVA